MTPRVPLAAAAREIRAPRSHVFHRAADLARGIDWLWDREALPDISGEGPRPDGSRRFQLSNGEVLSVRVVDRDEPRSLEIETQQRPVAGGRDQQGRTLTWRLDLDSGPGTTRASLQIFRQGEAAGDGRVDARARAARWQRQAEGSIDRLLRLCEETGEAEDEGAGAEGHDA